MAIFRATRKASCFGANSFLSSLLGLASCGFALTQSNMLSIGGNLPAFLPFSTYFQCGASDSEHSNVLLTSSGVIGRIDDNNVPPVAFLPSRRSRLLYVSATSFIKSSRTCCRLLNVNASFSISRSSSFPCPSCILGRTLS